MNGCKNPWCEANYCVYPPLQCRCVVTTPMTAKYLCVNPTRVLIAGEYDREPPPRISWTPALMPILALAFLLLPAITSAQATLTPGQVFAFEIVPGTTITATGDAVARPEANLAFDYRIDADATPVPAVKQAPCTATAGAPGSYTCRLIPPVLATGSHTIAVRARPNPAEPGINPSDWTAPFGFNLVIATAPGVPSNFRVIRLP